ncbi:GGDEF domain-containing protein [Oceanobacillus halophilus]|uniref:GGDEF domain-containing protein n=1 Tax=Oceanobacillus halophilus TaxID=930130 RepID=A0A495A3D4_9BACI|nr:GGDEF domain-containing protein [Oceanobacillus halophilus]RKQ33468.1 GGDEF domain-containing protein [Oceanobacillus halophilus]
MGRLKVFIIGLFVASVVIAIVSGPIQVDTSLYIKTLVIYLTFTFLYSHLNTIFKKGNVTLEYGISYGLSIAMFTGPLGVFIYELIIRFYTYFQRKHTNTADEDEFLHTFYNIGAFALNHAIAFYLFHSLIPYFGNNTIGYWALIVILVVLINFLSDIYLSIVLHSIGEIKTLKDVFDFMIQRNVSDTLKKAVSNGLLYVFLIEQRWDLLFALFVLNYLVSRSFMVKSQSIQHKMERDRYEQMAYTDFLSKAHNRAYMNKIMNELNQSGEYLSIVVSDIDSFKRVNDTYNHTVGDQVIQSFANVMKSYLNKDDYLFRSGGEEFTLILRHRTYDESVALVKDIKQGIENNSVQAEYQSKRISISCTASFGLYYFRATESINIKDAYSIADDLLIKAKYHGKNKVFKKNGVEDVSIYERYSDEVEKKA